MTTLGGTGNFGVIFSFDPATSVYTKLKDFDNTNGNYPQGSLLQGADGKLYGMTESGGTRGFGVIFSFDPSTSDYTNLKEFDYTNGSNPMGNLLQTSDGKLYGMTPSGGTGGVGVIFSLDPSTSAYTKLKDFDDANGSSPKGSLMQATDGKLYGMTSGGSRDNRGVIFSFNPSGSAYTKLKDFDNTNGGNPFRNDLIQAPDGKLYGMTQYGGTSGYGIFLTHR